MESFSRKAIRGEQKYGNPELWKLLYKTLLVVGEVYRQQKEIYEEEKKRIDDRIVSIAQPHIRPIVTGKAGSAVEFGGKTRGGKRR